MARTVSVREYENHLVKIVLRFGGSGASRQLCLRTNHHYDHIDEQRNPRGDCASSSVGSLRR